MHNYGCITSFTIKDKAIYFKYCVILILVNRKLLYNICTMLVQRRIRRADVQQMLYKCFVLAGIQRSW